jgi:hypothetical protein
MTEPPTDDLVFYAEDKLRGREAAIRLSSLESVSDPLPGTATAPALEPVSPEDDTPPETMPGIAAV